MSGLEELTLGGATIRDAGEVPQHIPDQRLRARVIELLGMYRELAGKPEKAKPVRNIGVITVGANDFRQLTDREFREVQELRSILFLCCLAQNNRLTRNGGYMMYTAENFDVVRQNFVLESDRLSESAGVLVNITMLGYTIGQTRFVRPVHVNQPPRFRYDDKLLQQLRLLRRHNRPLYRRIARAGAVFLESYYNNPAVDTRARILLQTAAFEILLDLPEQKQRMVFKDEIERLVSNNGERKYRYKYERYGKLVLETRTIKGIWADRFYTLRNHIVHGENVPEREYVFRGAQHHLVIAPLMFMSCIKGLIDQWLIGASRRRAFFEKMDWVVIEPGEGSDPEARGFLIRDDFLALFNGAGVNKWP